MDAGTSKLAMQWISYYSSVDELIPNRLLFNEIRAQTHILKKKANPKRHSLNQSASRLAQAPAAIIEDGRLRRRKQGPGLTRPRSLTLHRHLDRGPIDSLAGPYPTQLHLRGSCV